MLLLDLLNAEVCVTRVEDIFETRVSCCFLTWLMPSCNTRRRGIWDSCFMLFSDLFDTELAQERYWQGSRSREVWNWRGEEGKGRKGEGEKEFLYSTLLCQRPNAIKFRWAVMWISFSGNDKVVSINYTFWRWRRGRSRNSLSERQLLRVCSEGVWVGVEEKNNKRLSRLISHNILKGK